MHRPTTNYYDDSPIRCLWVLNLSSSRIDTRQVDFGDELNGGGSVRIVISAMDVEAVNSILVCTLETPLSVSCWSWFEIRCHT